jgi:hypothetical protein
VRRRATIRIGVLSSLMLGTVALSGFGSPSSASSVLPSGGEFHAPRIPGPSTGPTPSKGPSPAFAPLFEAPQPWISRNWSGYAVTGNGFTSVVGNWKVPQVLTPNKKKKMARYSSSWVGIDGYANSDLIQAGTEQDWIRGKAFYQSWWEILPAAETPLDSLAIHPGDAMSVSITEGAFSVWTIQVSDTTTHQSFTVSRKYSGPETSAEWIQEAPTIGRNRLATLADETNAVFDLSRVNGSNPVFNINESGSMWNRGFKVRISTPSAPNPNRDGFAVAYGSVAPPAPTS